MQPRISGHEVNDWHMHVTGRGSSVSAEHMAGAVWGLAVWLCEYGSARFGVCADERCGNVYLDTSSNCCRRFCSERCATRSHVAAHRARKRAAVDRATVERGPPADLRSDADRRLRDCPTVRHLPVRRGGARAKASASARSASAHVAATRARRVATSTATEPVKPALRQRRQQSRARLGAPARAPGARRAPRRCRRRGGRGPGRRPSRRPSSSASLPGGRAVRQVQRVRVVAGAGSGPSPGTYGTNSRAPHPDRVHVLHREARCPGSSFASSAQPVDEAAGVVALPGERRMHHDGRRAELARPARPSGAAAPTGPDSTPAGSPAGRARAPNRPAPRSARTGPCSAATSWLTGSVQTITSTPVVAEASPPVSNAADGRLGEDGRGREQDRDSREGHHARVARSAAASVERSGDRRCRSSASGGSASRRSQDHALAQRPRADVDVVQAEPAHRRPRPRSRRRAAGGPGRRSPRPSRRARRRDVPDEAEHLVQSGAGQRPRRRGTRRADGAAPASRASVRKVFEVATARSQPPIGRHVWRARSSDVGRSARRRRAAGGGSAESRSRVSRPAPSGSDSATSGSSSMPAADLQRAAADVEHQQPAGRPAEPAAYRQEGHPGLVRAGEHAAGRRRSRARTRASTLAELVASRTAEVAKAEQVVGARARRPRPAPSRPRSTSSSAASLEQLAVAADLFGQPQHRSSPSAPATDGRPGGRRPRAGGPCWSRRRERPAAYRRSLARAHGWSATSLSAYAIADDRRAAPFAATRLPCRSR